MYKAGKLDNFQESSKDVGTSPEGFEEKEGQVFIIRPENKGIRRLETDYDKLLVQYQHGYELAHRLKSKILNFINEK